MTIGIAIHTDQFGRPYVSSVYAGDDYVEFGITPGYPGGSGCPDVSVDGAAVTGMFCTSPSGGAGFTFANQATSGVWPDGILYPGAHVNFFYTHTPTGTQNVDLVYWPPLDIGPHPINSPPAPSYLPDGYTGRAYAYALTASGGQPNPAAYTFVQTGGALPPGLVLSSAGVITGTPSGTIGDYTISVQLSDAGGSDPTTGRFQITIYAAPSTLHLGPDPVDAPPAPAILPNAELGKPYTFPLVPSGGSGTPPAYTFIVWGGALPAGLNLSASTGVIDGVISSIGSIAGVYVVTVRLTDATPKVAAYQTFQITVGAPPPAPGMTPRTGLGGGGTPITFHHD